MVKMHYPIRVYRLFLVPVLWAPGTVVNNPHLTHVVETIRYSRAAGCGSMGTLHTRIFLFFANNFFLMCAMTRTTTTTTC